MQKLASSVVLTDANVTIRRMSSPNPRNEMDNHRKPRKPPPVTVISDDGDSITYTVESDGSRSP